MHFRDHSIKLLSEVHYDRFSSSTAPSPLRIKANFLWQNPKHILPTTTTTTPTMVPHIKALVFILLFLFVSSFSGCADGFKDGAKLPYPNSSVKGTGCPTQGTKPECRTGHVPVADNIQLMARKLIGVDAMLDYEKPGSNSAHTPDNGGKDNVGKDNGGKPRKGGSVNN